MLLRLRPDYFYSSPRLPDMLRPAGGGEGGGRDEGWSPSGCVLGPGGRETKGGGTRDGGSPLGRMEWPLASGSSAAGSPCCRAAHRTVRGLRLGRGRMTQGGGRPTRALGSRRRLDGATCPLPGGGYGVRAASAGSRPRGRAADVVDGQRGKAEGGRARYTRRRVDPTWLATYGRAGLRPKGLAAGPARRDWLCFHRGLRAS